MHVLARAALRTEARQIVCTEDAADVAMPAMRSVSAKAAVIPRTVLDLAFRIYVQKGAFLVVAGVESGIEVAFRHLCHVEFVEKLALVALLAEAAQPVLTHDGPVPANVPERTIRTLFAFHPVNAIVKLADGRRGLCKAGER